MKKSKLSSTCPHCGQTSNQIRNGHTPYGTQKVLCKCCHHSYSVEPKHRAYTTELVQQALKIYYAGASGRAVGKILGMSKANVYNWIKKNSPKP